MDSGFDTVKDLLSVVIIPIAIFAVGALLPRWFEATKTRKFLTLIERELQEMEPWPKEPSAGGKWHEHLKKRFVHEEIFESVSENRDFILSLPPEVTYNVAQLWIHFKKAQSSEAADTLAEHGASWCDYVRALCSYFDRRGSSNYAGSVYESWRRLVLEYHPDAEATQRLKSKIAEENADGYRAGDQTPEQAHYGV